MCAKCNLQHIVTVPKGFFECQEILFALFLERIFSLAERKISKIYVE